MKDISRQNNHGGADIVPALIDVLLGAGVDVANDFVLVYDASAGSLVKTTIGQLFLATGWNPSTPGAIDNVVIGDNTPAAGWFTDTGADNTYGGNGYFTSIRSTTGTFTDSLTVFKLQMGTFRVAAAGSDQAGATLLERPFTAVTDADDAKGVRLPAAELGLFMQVKNTVLNKILKLYPATGAKIDGAAANAALSIAAGVGVTLISDGTDWHTV